MSVSSSVAAVTAKVQLHVHLDGAIRLETAWELSRQKNIDLLGVSSLAELKSKVIVEKPETLTTFLHRFQYFAPVFCGDIDAIRRMAEEFAEDCVLDNIVYCEARFSPHLLIGTSSLTPDDVVETVCDAFRRAEEQHKNIKLRVILCCMRHLHDMSGDVHRLCVKYRDSGVVAIDIAGDENMVENGTPTHANHIQAFQDAKEFGIHRTAHAGENGSSEVVKEAMEVFYTERVGHGYHVLEDPILYKTLLQQGLHLELCPWSSVLTSATTGIADHPAKRFIADGANFSISTDDPTLTGTKLSDEFALLQNAGVAILDLIRSNFNAARSSFLPDDEKEELLQTLRSAYAHLPEVAAF